MGARQAMSAFGEFKALQDELPLPLKAGPAVPDKRGLAFEPWACPRGALQIVEAEGNSVDQVKWLHRQKLHGTP